MDDRERRAILALNGLLVMLRHLALQEQSSRTMYGILDATELMPLLLLKGDLGYVRFEEMLVDLAARYPRECTYALQKFRYGDAPVEG